MINSFQEMRWNMTFLKSAVYHLQITHRGYYLDSGGLYHPTQLFPLFFPFSIHTMRQGQGLAVTVITEFAVPVLVTSPTFYFFFPLYFSRRYQGFWILDFGFWKFSQIPKTIKSKSQFNVQLSQSLHCTALWMDRDSDAIHYYGFAAWTLTVAALVVTTLIECVKLTKSVQAETTLSV